MLMQKLRDPRIMKVGMWIILGITIPSFVLFYGFSKSDNAHGMNMTDLVTVKNSEGTVKLGSTELREAENEYPTELMQMAQMFGVVDMRNYSAEVANIRRALKPKEKADFAVSQLVLRQRLAKQGIRVTDEQVKQLLSDEGVTREQLNRILKQNNLSEYQYAAMMRDNIAAGQAANTVSRLAHPSLIELYNNYIGASEKITVTLARIAAQPDQNYNPTEEEIAAKYKALVDAKDPRAIQAEQRIYNYVKLDIPTTPPQKPTEEQLLAEFASAEPDDKQLINPASATLRRIIISFPGGDEAAKEPAKKKAQEAHDRIAKGEDFAAVANEVSEDPLNVKPGQNGSPDEKLGGLLPTPTSEREAMIYGEKYSTFVKSAELNTLSDVIEMPMGYAILRVEGRQPESRMDFAAARNIITRRVQQKLNQQQLDARNAVASDKLKAMRDAAAQETTLDGIARVLKTDVKETSPTTTLSTFINGPGSFTSSADALKSLRPKGHTDVLQNSLNEPVILSIKQVIPERQRDLAEMKTVLISVLRQELAEKQAKEKADALQARVVAGDSLTSAAAELKVTAETLPPFSRGDDVRAISPQLMGFENIALFIGSAKKGEPRVLREGRGSFTQGYGVLEITSAETPSVQDFVKNMSAIEMATLRLKRTAYLAEFRRDAVKTSKVTYNEMYVTPEEPKKKSKK